MTSARNIEEYAVECSILKIYGSEMLTLVADELIATMGGYGYTEEYPAERTYRDARINRIFEGTNEINRLIVTGWMMKRALKRQAAAARGHQARDGRSDGAAFARRCGKLWRAAGRVKQKCYPRPGK